MSVAPKISKPILSPQLREVRAHPNPPHSMQVFANYACGLSICLQVIFVLNYKSLHSQYFVLLGPSLCLGMTAFFCGSWKSTKRFFWISAGFLPLLLMLALMGFLAFTSWKDHELAKIPERIKIVLMVGGAGMLLNSCFSLPAIAVGIGIRKIWDSKK
jgi:hypothetical protein